MSKSKNKRTKSSVEKLLEKAPNRRRLILIGVILVGLLTAGGALAQWTGIFSTVQKNKQKSGGDIVATSFDPASPSKEYIYAGGRLIATEEPPATSCNYSITPTGRSFAWVGGNDSVTVTAGTGCNWTAVSNANWLTITSGPSGSGSGA